MNIVHPKFKKEPTKTAKYEERARNLGSERGMLKILPWLVVILMGLVSPSSGQDTAVPEKKINQYLCVTEQSVGFKYDEHQKKWLGSLFSPDDKYIIRESKEKDFRDMEGFFEFYPKLRAFDNANYVVQSFGFSMVEFFCYHLENTGVFVCEGPFGYFQFNIQSLRFQRIYDIGYVLTPRELGTRTEGKNTPSMEIGKCTPF